MKTVLKLLTVAALALTGCDSGERQTSGNTTSQMLHPFQVHHARHENPAQIRRGREIYRRNCASCHGDRAEGHPKWQWLGPDGKFPPPPLNGTGHAWHHPTSVLHDIIKNGSPAGQGNMPAWGSKLTDNDIDAVIYWFQSLWPDEVYRAWFETEKTASGGDK